MQALSRLGLTALFTTLVLALVGALFNNEYAFYTSWGDLLGDSPEDTPRHYGAPTPAPALDQQAPSASAGPTAPTTPQALPALPQPGQRLQKYEIPGPKNADGRPTASR